MVAATKRETVAQARAVACRSRTLLRRQIQDRFSRFSMRDREFDLTFRMIQAYSICMKISAYFVLFVATIIVVGLSHSSQSHDLLNVLQKKAFAAMLSASETYDSIRPEQKQLDAEWEASRQRIITADNAASQQRIASQLKAKLTSEP